MVSCQDGPPSPGTRTRDGLSRRAVGSLAMGNLVRPRSLSRAAAALRSGEITAAAAAAGTCDRIGEVDPEVHAFVAEAGRPGRLSAEASSVSERWTQPWHRPALYGVPVGVKDIIRVDGLPTRAGSALPPAVLGGTQAAAVDRLRDAGALIAGKTVTAEFAAAAPGPTRNPHNVRHTPGGSSSGSAAAVATGAVPLAIGTQTVGSTIRPAAYCGVVGFKPSYGRIPADGVIANAPAFDTVGFFTADVASAELAAAVLCDGWRPVTRAARLPVLGIPAGPYLERAGGEAAEAFERHAALLRAAGFGLVRLAVLRDFGQVVACQQVINRYEIAQAHAGWFPQFGHLYRDETTAAILAGQLIGRGEYLQALRAREQFRGAIMDAMSVAGIDLWITPAATGPAPAETWHTGDPIMCLPWSYARLPAASLPAGRARNGLPLGLQLVGGSGADEELLSWAGAVETVLTQIS
jgi:Asp-tRNA(Asn)/Glu-tRNA(Gln) amidotransferase A subunit family amidase